MKIESKNRENFRQIAKICPELPWVFYYGQMPQAQAIAIKKLFDREGLLDQSLKDSVFT